MEQLSPEPLAPVSDAAPADAAAPAEEWFAGWRVTKSQLRQVAAGELPPEWVTWAQECLEWIDETAAEALARRERRRRKTR